MEKYISYQGFVDDLMKWGKVASSQWPNGWRADEEFENLWIKMSRGAQENIFFPFLYMVLSAGLTKNEAVLLAAVFYSELFLGESEAFTFQSWKNFWDEEDVDSFAGDLFYGASRILYEREVDPIGYDMRLRITPQVFLFLSRNILEDRNVPGMRWYYHYGDDLAFVGKKLRKYDAMSTCMEEIQGKKLFYLQGKQGSGRKLNYAYMAQKLGKSLATVSYVTLQSVDQLREMRVECLLHHAMLVVDLAGIEETDLSAFLRQMEEEEAIFLTGEWEDIPYCDMGGRQYLSFAIHPHEVLSDKDLFQNITSRYRWEQEEVRLNFLGRYDFLPGKMTYILELAKAYDLSEGRDCISAPNLKRAILQSGGHSLRRYAKKIEVVYTMEDLILPPGQKQKLQHICNRVKNKKHVYEEWGFQEKSAYGNGVSMIFAGPPGTGKTMAAQVIAGELGMELYRVELPAIVDKYIGETEKKLNRIFEEAKKSMAILFFDEADVLFSKRTEIKDSNDKYSNMEIAFLLQKMEEHDGVSILATNYLQNFDEAFRRRISDIVDFPMPDEALREMMWKSMIPNRLPVSEDMDFPFLASQFPVTGSVIKNSLIYGSFLAAEMPEQLLTMREVLAGLGHELQKSGKKLSRNDYGEYQELFEQGRVL